MKSTGSRIHEIKLLALPRSCPACILCRSRLGRASGRDAAEEDKLTQPNILVIVADDLGYGDIGVHGGKDVPTSNIDALAASGVRCTNGYVSAPYCSPSRAGFLTGCYQTRFGRNRKVVEF